MFLKNEETDMDEAKKENSGLKEILFLRCQRFSA